MKLRIVYHWLFLLIPFGLFSAPPKVDNFNKGLQLAQLYNKPLILVFTGSDWCSWSEKVSKEIFESKEFSQAIGNSFIFVQVDFPRSTESTVIVCEKNLQLKKKYQVTSFPTLVMIEPTGKEITRLSYSDKTADQFAVSLKSIFSKFLHLQNEVETLDLASIKETKLENLYNEAVTLRCPMFISQILEQGLKTGKSAFFPLEKYSQLALEGKIDEKEAQILKGQIVERDKDDNDGARLRLALLDFQSHIEDPDLATQEPLSYIEDFGKTKEGNLWRLHMLISDYFSEHGRQEEAKEHAEKTLETAPAGIRSLLSVEME